MYQFRIVSAPGACGDNRATTDDQEWSNFVHTDVATWGWSPVRRLGPPSSISSGSEVPLCRIVECLATRFQRLIGF